ncbi:aminoglycoside phosphotransferase family protein [Actinopolymorpha alba]|uniref:aminoglycoside phosphotransferase family protein n=1 Tax=Actinopolymorpha alba TaxID=533267 RepID=UPI00036F47DA|nr:aminoglycoside phosphotransferase family protein [Actinopolymorpha alba]
MLDDELVRVMRSVGLDGDVEAINLSGGASGSGVYRVQIDEDEAVLKVTTAGYGQKNARRELAFYRTLADRVPVTTPRLLRSADNEEFTAVLLSAHASALPARDWGRASWLEVTRQLAALHSMPPPDEAPWIDQPWHRQVPYQPPTDLAENYWSKTDAADSVRPFLDAPDDLAKALRAIPDSFLHGDCHVENLLRDGPQIVWTDWQVAGVGCPAGELAFLWSRAGVDGADVPYDEMLREYVTHRDIDLALLRPAVVAAEINLLLFAWPHFAPSCTPDERDHLTRRLLQLIEDWHT